MYQPDHRWHLEEPPDPTETQTPTAPLLWRLLAHLTRPKLGTWLYCKANNIAWIKNKQKPKYEPSSYSTPSYGTSKTAPPINPPQTPLWLRRYKYLTDLVAKAPSTNSSEE